MVPPCPTRNAETGAKTMRCSCSESSLIIRLNRIDENEKTKKQFYNFTIFETNKEWHPNGMSLFIYELEETIFSINSLSNYKLNNEDSNISLTRTLLT